MSAPRRSADAGFTSTTHAEVVEEEKVPFLAAPVAGENTVSTEKISKAEPGADGARFCCCCSGFQFSVLFFRGGEREREGKEKR